MKVDPAFEDEPCRTSVSECSFLETLDGQIGGIIRLFKDKGITTNANSPSMPSEVTMQEMCGSVACG